MDDVLQQLRDIRFELDKKLGEFKKQIDVIKSEINLDQVNERLNELEDLQMLLQAEMIELSNIVTGQVTPMFSKDIEKRLSTVEDAVSKILDDLEKLGGSEQQAPLPISKIEERFQKYDEILQKVRDFMASHQGSVGEPTSDLTPLQSKVEKLEKELEEVKTHLVGAQVGSIDETWVKKELESLKNEIKSIEDENENRIEKDLSQVKDKFSSIEVKLESLDETKKEIDSLKDKIKSIEDKSGEHLEKDLAALKDRISELEDKMSGMKNVSGIGDEISSMMKELMALKGKISLIEETSKKLSQSFEDLEKKINEISYSNEFSAIKNEINELRETTKSVEKEIDEIRSYKKGIEENIDELRNKINEIGNKISSVEKSAIDDSKIRRIAEDVLLEQLRNFARTVDEKFPELLTKKDLDKIETKLRMLFAEVEALRRKIEPENVHEILKEKVVEKKQKEEIVEETSRPKLEIETEEKISPPSGPLVIE